MNSMKIFISSYVLGENPAQHEILPKPSCVRRQPLPRNPLASTFVLGENPPCLAKFSRVDVFVRREPSVAENHCENTRELALAEHQVCREPDLGENPLTRPVPAEHPFGREPVYPTQLF